MKKKGKRGKAEWQRRRPARLQHCHWHNNQVEILEIAHPLVLAWLAVAVRVAHGLGETQCLNWHLPELYQSLLSDLLAGRY
jgi:hypothetical protein